MTFLAPLLLIIFLFSVLLLAYIYIGYPVLIVLMAKFFRRPVNKRTITPSVTLVIPTFNEEVVIKEKLENTLHLDYPRDRLQILVCDDASADRTAEIVKDHVRWDRLEKLAAQRHEVTGCCHGGVDIALALADARFVAPVHPARLARPFASGNHLRLRDDTAHGIIPKVSDQLAQGPRGRQDIGVRNHKDLPGCQL